jgi:hypothetical protein
LCFVLDDFIDFAFFYTMTYPLLLTAAVRTHVGKLWNQFGAGYNSFVREVREFHVFIMAGDKISCDISLFPSGISRCADGLVGFAWGHRDLYSHLRYDILHASSFPTLA